jgi:hypothetical protein
MIRSSINELKRAVRTGKTKSAPVRKLHQIPVPFSFTGIIAVLVCPVLLLTDIFTPGFAFLGIIYVIILSLLGNERRTLIALFATVATITLAIDIRMTYGQEGAELGVADKIFGLMSIPVLAYALIQQRNTQQKKAKRKKIVNMTVMPPLNERIALNGETRSVFRHICRSNGPMDEYTRELIWFVYLKSPKN